MSEKMITLDNLETLVNNIEAEINESAESKLDREDGIKIFFGTEPSDNTAPGAVGGDMFFAGHIGENRQWIFKNLYILGEYRGNKTWNKIAVGDKLNRTEGIKTFFGSSAPEPARVNYDGLMSGDIYFEGTSSRLGGSIRKVYVAHISDNNEDLVLWRELTTNLSDIWNNYYTKTETNNLLASKQDTLTEGFSIDIDDDTIGYVEPQWELFETIDVTNDPHKTYQLTGLKGYDDIMVEFIGVKANQNGLNPVAYFWFDGYENYVVGSDHVLGRIFGANELRNDIAKNRVTTITRMLGTNLFLQQTSLNVTTANQIQYNVSNQFSDDILNKKITKIYIDVSGGTSGMAYSEGTIKVYGRNRTPLPTPTRTMAKGGKGVQLTVSDEELEELKNLETDVLEPELNKIDNSDVEKDVSEIEPEKVEKIDKK